MIALAALDELALSPHELALIVSVFRKHPEVSRSLGGRRDVGCKLTAAVYFSPLSCQISRYSAAKSSKTILAGANFRFDAFCRPGS